MINAFLSHLYKVVSFESGEFLNTEEFRNLFIPNAILMEYHGKDYVSKTVEMHIQEFDDAVRDYPELFVKGFHEEQVSCEILKSSNAFLVSSNYKKTYSRDGKDVVEYGTNDMMIAHTAVGLKIASVVW